MEFSKKIAVADIVIYFILTIALIVVMVIDDTIAELCVDALTSVATVYTTLRSGYSLKAGVENYQKIKKLTADQIATNCNDSQG